MHSYTDAVSVCIVCMCVYACVSVLQAKEEAVAKDAGKVCSFGVLLPVCFSLYGPSSAGWGWRVSPSPRGPGAVRTSKLLVTTGSGIQLNTHRQIHPNAHTYTHYQDYGEIDRWGVYILERPLPVDRTTSQWSVFVCMCVYMCVGLCALCTVHRGIVCMQYVDVHAKKNKKKKRTYIIYLYMLRLACVCAAVHFHT